ncbi:hypothetical protein [Microvirga ossetica]|uniref:hypothetical protein n=1 Tax=Microvirga ossetica TaxID=1882682 RepID=UPI0012FFDAAB|nr:hypothetical protein [Microvirga ossetica]
MFLTLRPLGRGRFSASIDGRVICESRTPLFDAARILYREGIPPETVIAMSHEGSQVVSMVSTVGKAAKLTVIERDDRGLTFETYRPLSPQDASATVAVASQTPFVGSPDAFPIQTEMSLPDAFADDHARV